MDLRELNRLDLEPLSENIPEGGRNDFLGLAGREHYRLLNYLCTGKKLVFDIGTYRGSSSIAMSSAKKVISYDVEKLREVKKLKNITYKIGEVMDDKQILEADVILLDTYHDGTYEREFYQFLRDYYYKGILVLDDIHLNPEMERLWSNIIDPKDDFTEIGHYTGTGVVYMGGLKRLSRCNSCG